MSRYMYLNNSQHCKQIDLHWRYDKILILNKSSSSIWYLCKSVSIFHVAKMYVLNKLDKKWTIEIIYNANKIRVDP